MKHVLRADLSDLAAALLPYTLFVLLMSGVVGLLLYNIWPLAQAR